MKSPLVAAGLLAASFWSSLLVAAPVASISQYGVTWTFDKAYEAGQFATGDWWVVGPVTITSVSPAPTGTRHGSALNPRGGRQGYDSRGGGYATSDNVSFPRSLQADQSLVSSVSRAEGAEIKNVGALQSQAVLTVVSRPQPAGSLRPSYAGTYKKYLNLAQVDWSRLPRLTAPASKPNGANLLRYADRPHVDHLSSWTIQNSCAGDNWQNGVGHPCYGRDYSDFISIAAQYVMLDTAEQRELAASLIQLGIDNYGVLKAGGNWAANGGHHSGRKWPIVFAARLLNDCDMLRVGADYGDAHFSEDGHTYYGTSGTALFGWDCGGGHGSYFQNGCSGSGAKDCRDPARTVDACPDYRNCCTSHTWVGQMLAALMLQSKSVWQHDAYFDYVDRWMNGGVSGGGAASSAFVEQMWSLYRSNLPNTKAPPTACGGSGGSGGTAGSGGVGGTPGTGGVGGSSASGAAGQAGSAGQGSGAGGGGTGGSPGGSCAYVMPDSSAASVQWIALFGLLLGAWTRRPRR